MKRLILLLVITGSLAAASLSDAPNPNRKKSEPPRSGTGQMVLRMRSDNVDIATLKLSRSKLQELRAAIDLAEGEDAMAARVDDPALRGGALRTIVAGLLLSAAMVLGGFVFLRRSSAGGRAALSIAVVGAVGLGALAVIANTPPPALVGLTSRIFADGSKAYGYARGPIAIQIVDGQSEDVVLEFPAVGDDKRD